MKRALRYRSLFLASGTTIAALLSFYTDPDVHGLSTMLGGLAIAQGIWAIAAAHVCRKALTDYTEADQKRLFGKALETSTGAGLALIALAIIFVGLLFVFAPRAHANELPKNYIKYGAILKAEQKKYWPNHPNPSLLAALVEQESCSRLTSPNCWSPQAKLKEQREEGAGLGQITRAYRKDGSLRFDALSDLKQEYNIDLNELSWYTIYQRPDLQLRALVLMARDSAKPFYRLPSWLEFGDAAYNGGIVGVQKERRACGLLKNCDPSKWFANVEYHCLKSRQILYNNLSACDINRTHVKNVFLIRRLKYIESMK